MSLYGGMDNELNKTHERQRWAAMQRVDYSKYQSDIKTALQYYGKPPPKRIPVKKTTKFFFDGKAMIMPVSKTM